MVSVSDIRVEVAAAVADIDRAASWRFIEFFAREWATPVQENDGYGEAELLETEHRLGIRLPPALVEAYKLIGRRDDLVRQVNPLCRPESLYLTYPADRWGESGTELLVYRHENQGSWECAIRLSDLSLDDPPTVFLNTCDDALCLTQGVPWLDRLSLSIVEIVLSEVLAVDDHSLVHIGTLKGDQIPVLKEAFPKLGLPSYPISRPPCRPGVDWFVGDDAIIQVDRRTDINGQVIGYLEIRGRTSQAADAARKKLPPQWFEKNH